MSWETNKMDSSRKFMPCLNLFYFSLCAAYNFCWAAIVSTLLAFSYIFFLFTFGVCFTFFILFTDCEITQVMIMITQVSLSIACLVRLHRYSLTIHHLLIFALAICHDTFSIDTLLSHTLFICQPRPQSFNLIFISQLIWIYLPEKFILWRFNFNSKVERGKKTDEWRA